MIVSIFTDASVNITTGQSGYAFYIGCKEGKIQKAGKLKVLTKDSTTAELHCLANAIYTLTRSKFEGLTKVCVFTDSKISIQAINNAATFRDKGNREVLEELRFLMMEYCIRYGHSIRDYRKFFDIKHIKAHTGKKDKLSLINNWCDKNACKFSK